MGYYIRVLGKTDPTITVDQLRGHLRSENLKGAIEVDSGTESDWTTLIVKDPSNRDIILLEKNPVVDGELGQEEIEEFKDDIANCKPASAVKWLTKYFDKVKVIYAFQILNSVDNDENWNIVGELKSFIWRVTTGILQADHEGFTNEEGYHILWQFSDNVTGQWTMAVRNIFGQWTEFEMDLGDKEQRQEFWDNKVPRRARRI
jgi:hypothetical protein